MIITNIKHEDIIKIDPALDDELRSDQINFDDLRDQAFREMLKDFKDRGHDLRRLCIPLELQESVTKTEAFDGAKSDSDLIERLKLIIEVTALTGNAVFDLQGTNDDSDESYTDVLKNMVITEKGTYVYTLSTVYQFYRLRLISIGTTITYSAAMYETIYDLLHLYKTVYMIYRTLWANGNDVYESKFTIYREMYEDMLNRGRYYYDADDDAAIDVDEKEQDQRRIIFTP